MMLTKCCKVSLVSSCDLSSRCKMTISTSHSPPPWSEGRILTDTCVWGLELTGLVLVGGHWVVFGVGWRSLGGVWCWVEGVGWCLVLIGGYRVVLKISCWLEIVC
eukprot:TRINITY_DN3834_c0_g1_i1.p1 TRINITY_DN3834_c0_g1~~TRINITY_DN3834_c0_g1_i1.p1  ORF type:complete len:105 (+),score=24.17 TRINITY_DN3834_c0_g1_i1:501-815(+)